jgi:ubiquinone/menaquinone biosynthesis C-methylase UbiE
MSKWGIEERETIDKINEIGFSGNILNIAAGDGRFNDKLLEISDSVTAIDIDENELKILKDNCPNDLKNKLHIKVVDITKTLPFEESSFDGIFCTGTLHLFDEIVVKNILKEIKRVLKPSGKIVLDFATDIKRIDDKGNNIVFEGEGNYNTEDSINLFRNELTDFSLNIEKSTFKEEDLDISAGYKQIAGNFLIISGTKD